MTSPIILTALLLLCTSKVSSVAAQQADTLHLMDYNDAVLVISTSDYKNIIAQELGGKANLYLHHIDSLTSNTNEGILRIDKEYCTSLPYYDRKDYQKFEHGLMDAFVGSKLSIIKGGVSYNLHTSQIVKRKTRICNRPIGKVTGVNWVIKDPNNNATIAELNKSKTIHAYRLVSCF